MKKLDWFIVKKFLGTYVFMIGVVMSISIIFDVSERMEGTGADDVRGINGHDFGTFTSSGTGTHYASLVLTPDNNTVVARHSSTVRLIVQEVAQ